VLGLELEGGKLLRLEQDAVGSPAVLYVVGVLLTEHGSSEFSLYRLRRLGRIGSNSRDFCQDGKEEAPWGETGLLRVPLGGTMMGRETHRQQAYHLYPAHGPGILPRVRSKWSNGLRLAVHRSGPPRGNDQPVR
jgi:hypothetical protein